MACGTPDFLQRFSSAMAFGEIVSIWSMFYIILEVITVFCIELFFPDNEVDVARPFNHLRAKVNVRN